MNRASRTFQVPPDANPSGAAITLIATGVVALLPLSDNVRIDCAQALRTE